MRTLYTPFCLTVTALAFYAMPAHAEAVAAAKAPKEITIGTVQPPSNVDAIYAKVGEKPMLVGDFLAEVAEANQNQGLADLKPASR